MLSPDLTADDFIKAAADPELRAQWPQFVTELVDVVQAALTRADLSAAQAEKLASVVVLAIAFYLGGRVFYLPTGSRVSTAIRRRLIFRAWQAGESVKSLQTRHRVSHETVYAAIREGKARTSGVSDAAVADKSALVNEG